MGVSRNDVIIDSSPSMRSTSVTEGHARQRELDSWRSTIWLGTPVGPALSRSRETLETAQSSMDW
jgi:hypothetical protein